MERKQLPIGISDYKLIIEDDYYFVDKTNFARQLLEEGNLITLIPRPRRFGKTLNLSILRYFYEKTEGNIYRHLFEGMNIERWEHFEKYQGKYPVIMLTLKDCKGETFEDTLKLISKVLQQEYIRHQYLLKDEMNEGYRRQFMALINAQANLGDCQDALSLLSYLLTVHHGIPPLVLLDEIDTPIHISFDKYYY
ncbi:MAG: AAA family ATPase, partial [Bacteroidaceae bacterium]